MNEQERYDIRRLYENLLHDYMWLAQVAMNATMYINNEEIRKSYLDKIKDLSQKHTIGGIVK